MEDELPDLNKEFPTFLDLFIEAGKYEIDNIQRTYKNRNGDIIDPIQKITCNQYGIQFNQYLCEIEGDNLLNSDGVFQTKYFTLRYFLDFIAKGKSDIQKLIEAENQKKKFVDGELKKRLNGVLTEPKKVFVQQYQAFLIFYDKLPEPNRFKEKKLRQLYTKWSWRTNRVKFDIEDENWNSYRLEMFEKMIPELKSPKGQEDAKSDYELLRQNIENEKDKPN